MCGISAQLGFPVDPAGVERMVAVQEHRGPDDQGIHVDSECGAVLGHNRLEIIDLTRAGHQPMLSPDGRYALVYNGEVYNYRELARELSGWDFVSRSDTEVVLAAFATWGKACLGRFIGMFAFVVWDRVERTAFAARDRFGVKPLHYGSLGGGRLAIASEIKALHAAGLEREPDDEIWCRWLATGSEPVDGRTFWGGASAVPAGGTLTWREGSIVIEKWYDLAAVASRDDDVRPAREVAEQYRDLLTESVSLRFRSDVPVGVNVSGGLDSSVLLSSIAHADDAASDASAFTFTTGDPDYDELPWVGELLDQTGHRLSVAQLSADAVPALAQDVQRVQDEPFGGLPTLAYAHLFETASAEGVTVLLDGQGMDEQWCGYDYYQRAAAGTDVPVVQGGSDSPVRPGCLTAEARSLAEGTADPSKPAVADPLRAVQVRDLTMTKIPRALRYNDRVSMRVSRELREPFLDHRLVELALLQPRSRKVDLATGAGKVMLRSIASDQLSARLVSAPKRPVQTPQREWLRGPLGEWAGDMIATGMSGLGSAWLDGSAVEAEWTRFRSGRGDNSFFAWQWITLGLVGGLS